MAQALILPSFGVLEQQPADLDHFAIAAAALVVLWVRQLSGKLARLLAQILSDGVGKTAFVRE
jgi:hypothetical protein